MGWPVEDAGKSESPPVMGGIEVALVGSNITSRESGQTGSGRQGRNPAAESPAVSIARVGYVAIPQLMMGNHISIAWCKRPGCPVDIEPQRWVQPGGLARMGA